MEQSRKRIVSDPDRLEGEPHIEGHRISVLQLYEEIEENGESPRVVAHRYDLNVAGVYRALAYYHENPREIAAVRERREQRIETGREQALEPEDMAG